MTRIPLDPAAVAALVPELPWPQLPPDVMWSQVDAVGSALRVAITGRA